MIPSVIGHPVPLLLAPQEVKAITVTSVINDSKIIFFIFGDFADLLNQLKNKDTKLALTTFEPCFFIIKILTCLKYFINQFVTKK